MRSLGSPIIIDTQTGRQVLSEPFILHHGVEGLGCSPGSNCCEKCRTASVGSLNPSDGELDFRDPMVLRELRLAMTLSPLVAYLYAKEPELMEEFNSAAFIDDPIWGVSSTKLALLWISQYEKHRAQSFDVNQYFTPPSMYPTARGVVLIMGELGYYQPNGGGIPAKFPRLSAYMQAVGTTYGEGGSVEPPFLTDSEKQGGLGLQASTLAMAGIGAVAVAIFFMTLRTKGR